MIMGSFGCYPVETVRDHGVGPGGGVVVLSGATEGFAPAPATTTMCIVVHLTTAMSHHRGSAVGAAGADVVWVARVAGVAAGLGLRHAGELDKAAPTPAIPRRPPGGSAIVVAAAGLAVW